MANSFIISALHILPQCDSSLKKGLKDEWFLFNDSVRLEGTPKKIVRNHKNSMKGDYYGKNISISAIVGVNGSGKSSLFEMLYRIINNVSALFERYENRNAARKLYFIKGLYCELFYIVDGKLCQISCLGSTIKITLPNGEKELSTAKKSTKDNLLNDFIKDAWEGLFFTIVTNYSMQSFISNDYINERVIDLETQTEKEEASWINSLFHKNDGYMTPIVLNPYRDNGKIDMNKEHRLTIYRLSSCLIHARNNKKNFINGYDLHDIKYEYNANFVTEKIQEETGISMEDIWNYAPNKNDNSLYIDVILKSYGIDLQDSAYRDKTDEIDEIYKRAAVYLAFKTLIIATRYPSYNKYQKYAMPKNLFSKVDTTTSTALENLVKAINADKSHITIKVRQMKHFLEAPKNNAFKKVDLMIGSICIDSYITCVRGKSDSKDINDIQEFLPPSFFTCEIELKRIKDENIEIIPLARLSSGERQYLYTFSTFIYHTLNLLSINSDKRVRFCRVNLVMDEVEICFHPEYQRRFISEMIGYIERLDLNKNMSFNILIATHSPFILSDILKGNILYLDDGKNTNITDEFKNPFCANICDLLYQSFFLKEGFIGEYSRQKLRSIFLLLNKPKSLSTKEIKEKKIEEQLRFYIEEVGDPFIIMQIKQLAKLQGLNINEKIINRR
jgi:hypothetical protein